jgi:trimeric autotransporter adhesin
MKKLTLLSAVLFSLAACNKAENITPNVPMKITKNIVLPKIDTIPDNAMLKIKLCKDSVNTDETTFAFNHLSSTTFCYNDDALYFAGFGQVGLASISADGKDMAIYSLPYKHEAAIGLDARIKADGEYLFKISFESKIPSSIHVWLRDIYLKDSLDISKGNYHFNVVKADTNSFGKRRFSIVLK